MKESSSSAASSSSTRFSICAISLATLLRTCKRSFVSSDSSSAESALTLAFASAVSAPPSDSSASTFSRICDNSLATFLRTRVRSFSSAMAAVSASAAASSVVLPPVVAASSSAVACSASAASTLRACARGADFFVARRLRRRAGFSVCAASSCCAFSLAASSSAAFDSSAAAFFAVDFFAGFSAFFAADFFATFFAEDFFLTSAFLAGLAPASSCCACAAMWSSTSPTWSGVSVDCAIFFTPWSARMLTSCLDAMPNCLARACTRVLAGSSSRLIFAAKDAADSHALAPIACDAEAFFAPDFRAAFLVSVFLAAMGHSLKFYLLFTPGADRQFVCVSAVSPPHRAVACKNLGTACMKLSPTISRGGPAPF